jgi:uncharacterized phage-associated protein
MPAPYSSLAIANEFIARSLADESRRITQMQAQKLVYLAHGWSLAGLDEPLVEDQFQAWEFGPVIPKLYSALRRYGRSPISGLICWGDDTPFPFDDDGEAHEELNPDEAAIIDFVWETYGSFPAFKLSALTHQPGTPWSNSFEHSRNRPIEDEQIKRHFQELLRAA